MRRKSSPQGAESAPRPKVRRDIRWDKLDNTAHLFPVIAREQMSNVYRISVTLTELIDPLLLQQALDLVLPRFDGFNLRLRRGVFWPCGVTPQAAVENAKPPIAITHAPGHMFITDIINSELNDYLEAKKHK